MIEINLNLECCLCNAFLARIEKFPFLAEEGMVYLVQHNLDGEQVKIEKEKESVITNGI